MSACVLGPNWGPTLRSHFPQSQHGRNGLKERERVGIEAHRQGVYDNRAAQLPRNSPEQTALDVSLKVTDQPQESSFSDMVSGDAVLSIPLFQRAYRWGGKNMDWLMEDIAEVRSGVSKSCFLGVVVCVSRQAAPGRPIPWEIVDGQQRLSTLYLLLLAASEVGARGGALDWAAGVIGTYLLVRPLADNPSNTKLVPSYSDRAQFKKIWETVASVPGLMSEPSLVANLPRPPAPNGPESGNMWLQYKRLRKVLGEIREENGQAALAETVNAAASSLSLVSISLRDPLVAPKIFERLNNRAEPVTTADLVRNEVFSRASADVAQAVYTFTNEWEPFNARFSSIDKGLEGFLFPYGLLIDRTATKADLFAVIRKHWAMLNSPANIIADMQRYVATYTALEAGLPQAPPFSPEVGLRLDRIRRLGKPSSTYAFLFRLVEEVRLGAVSVEAAVDVLDALESFLFRRALQGIEPTGLHAVFKGMWSELMEGDNPRGLSAAALKDAIASKPTVTWPTNVEFEDTIRRGRTGKRKCVAFALQELEFSREGESPLDTFQIEHILPQAPTESWQLLFGDRYEELVQTWANLVPLTGRMNVAAGQAPFDTKREEYSDSIFATPREIAAKYVTWSPLEVEERASDIVQWALQRWPH